jgi:phosphoribosylformimino-5-aminoimidazole carboxamide ribotide isomerase
MRIVPVLDIQAGQVVRGVGGRRHEYLPIRSKLVAGAEPIAVSVAFRTVLRLNELYVGDLDAIAGKPPALDLYRGLRQQGFDLWVDAGLRDVEDAGLLLEAGVEQVVFGLETLRGPEALAIAVKQLGERAVFSLDLKSGQPLANRAAWDHADATSLAKRAIALGVRRMIVLDLAQVGSDAGTRTEALCREFLDIDPELELLAGGGVRDVADLRRLQSIGVSGVLIASALHDGRLAREELAPFLRAV